MARFGLIGGDYKSQSPNASCEQTINWYPEKIESPDGKSAMALYPCPGISLFVALADSPIRAFLLINGRMFTIAGGTLFEIFTDGTSTNRGTVASDGQPATMASSATQFLIVSAGITYYYTLATDTLVSLGGSGGANMLGTPSMCGFSDGYFIVLLKNTNQFQISGLLDASSWSALDTAKVSVFPDNIVSMLVDHREIWFFGLTKSVAYATTGNAGFPFSPIPSAFIEQGCGAQFSPARFDNSLGWWGADERGSMIAWRANGYTPIRISDHAIENEIQGLATNSDGVSYSYQDQGHTFWATRFPTASVTRVYDSATGMWHERSHLVNGVQKAHLSQYHVFAFGKHLVGDPTSGNIYQMSISIYDDAGSPIRRVRRSPHISVENQWMFHSFLQIDLEAGLGLTSGQGSDPQIMLRWSDDGGHTWNTERTVSAGKIGQYKRRAIFRRLGRSRDRVYEIAVSDPIPWRIIDGYVEASPGYGVTPRYSSKLRAGA